MADPASSSMVDVRPIMQAELKSRAVQLAGILHIRPEGFEGREAEAYQIMGHLAAMPAIKDHGQRRQYGNEILGNAAKAFSPSSAEGGPFHRDIEGLVIQMQEFPAWFRNLTDSNETLVENYVTAKRIADAMKWLGWGGLSTAGAKITSGARSGFGQALESGGGARALATGALKGGQGAATKLVTGGLSTRAGIFVWIVGEVAYQAIIADEAEMGQEITRRYQEGRLPGQLYQRAMGSETPAPTKYFFPL